MIFPKRLRRLLISLFAVINVATVLVVNRTDPVISAADKYVLQYLLPPVFHNQKIRNFFIYYAAYTGLDPRWTMFGRTQIYDWWHVIKAEYANSKVVVLPIPTQTSRTFMQRAFFDYKEIKFHVNIHESIPGQKAYASYLCRQYPIYDGLPIQSIIMEVHWQTRRDPYEAKIQGYHIMPGTSNRLIGAYPCTQSQN